MGLAFFQWCEGTFIGETVRTSIWLFPIIEAFHLLGLSLLGGAVLVLDLRLVGVMLGSEPIAELARSTRRWVVAGVTAMVLTGVPLFLSEAVKCYYNPSFWVKMATLPVAIGFTIAVRRWIAKRPPPPLRHKPGWPGQSRCYSGSPSPPLAGGSASRPDQRGGVFGGASFLSRPSAGDPVPDDPMKNFRPSVSVTSRPLARLSEWSLAW